MNALTIALLALSMPAPPRLHTDAEGAYATELPAGPGLARVLFDWGDGSLGAGSPLSEGSVARGRHGYARAGSYRVRARVVAPDGAVSAWSPAVTMRAPTAAEPDHSLTGLDALASSGAPHASARGVLSGAGWSSAVRGSPDRREWLAIDLGAPRAVNRIALHPAVEGGFPAAFAVDYCTDDGLNWRPIPIHQWDACPDIGRAALILEVGTLSARRIRITATRLGRTAGGWAFRLNRVDLRASREAPFFTSIGGAHDAALNNLWNTFGTAAAEVTPKGDAWWDGHGGVLAFGSTEWHEWDVMKLGWTDLVSDRAKLRRFVREMPMDPDGFVWACDGGPLHLGKQRHYDNNAINIIAAWRWYLWTREPGFFTEPMSAESRRRSPPTATTLLAKLRLAMEWQLERLHGREGLIRITDTGYDGRPASMGTTYWDAHPTGGLSALPNALFLASVEAMAGIEGVAGDTDRRAGLLELADRIRRRFNEAFWSPERGRFIATIDSAGTRHDYGLTAANLYAIIYGAATESHARRVMEWIGGRRLVAGDTSLGADIYHWRIAPRSNTVAFESVTPHWWAGDFAAVSLKPGEWGEWGRNIQNGGAILYTSYYDLMARLRVFGADDAYARMAAIIEAFHRTALRPARTGDYGPAGTPSFAVGVSVSFPESGLPPLAMLHGFLGVEPAADGLRIRPALPSAMAYAGVRDLFWCGRRYSITIRRGLQKATVRATGPGRFAVTAPNGTLTTIPPPG